LLHLLPSNSELAQAGVGPPGASLEFIERVTAAIQKLTNEGYRVCGQLAVKLNEAGIAANLGDSWTSRLVKLFDQRYSRLKLRF
jgi:hypothetical protein